LLCLHASNIALCVFWLLLPILDAFRPAIAIPAGKMATTILMQNAAETPGLLFQLLKRSIKPIPLLGIAQDTILH
jgi:hypothetical protein